MRISISNRITVGHWECVNQVLRRIYTTLTIQRGRIVILFFVQILLVGNNTTPADFCRIRIGETKVLDKVNICIPVPAVRIHTCNTTYISQRLGSIFSSLLPCHSTSRSISRRSSKEGNLSLEGSNHTTVDLTTLQTTECTVVLSSTTTSIFCRHGLYITILHWQILQSLIEVRQNLIYTLLKAVTWLVEISRNILRREVDGHTLNLTVHFTSVSTQQVEHVKTTQSVCLTLIQVKVHLVQRLRRVVPQNLVTVLEEQITVLDSVIANIPLVNRVVL